VLHACSDGKGSVVRLSVNVNLVRLA